MNKEVACSKPNSNNRRRIWGLPWRALPSSAGGRLRAADRMARTRLCGRNGIPEEAARTSARADFDFSRSSKRGDGRDELWGAKAEVAIGRRAGWRDDAQGPITIRFSGRNSTSCWHGCSKRFPAATAAASSIRPRCWNAILPAAGLGWFGKNTMLINKHQGSFFFIGAFLSILNFSPTPRI